MTHPRIHLAIRCGARPCPPVEVYRTEHGDAQRGAAARNFAGEEVRDEAAVRTTRPALRPLLVGAPARAAGVTP